MKAKELLKITTLSVLTAGFAVGCASNSSETTAPAPTAEPAVEEEACKGATPETRNAIYAAKLKNARARNLGFEWRDTAKLIKAAEKAAANCENVRAKILANKAEAQAAAAIAQYQAEQDRQAAQAEQDRLAAEAANQSSGSSSSSSSSDNDSMYIGGYLVVEGDNLWNIAGQDAVYGNPYQWPLIYKANSSQINDADLIYAGQYFNIPKAMEAESAAAIEHARTRGAWSLGETEGSDMDYLSQ